jgi:Tol biopolymer transport system component
MRLAVARRDDAAQGDIWLTDVEDGPLSRFTFEGRNLRPVWSPDGSVIAYNTAQVGMFRKASSGAGPAELLLKGSGLTGNINDWSRDGRFILFDLGGGGGRDLLVLPLEGERKPQPYLATRFSEYSGRFSADGRWIAYTSDDSGRREIYVQAFTPGMQASGARWQISSGGGVQPCWRRDGRELYYLARDVKLMAVSVDGTGAAFRFSTPAPLFETRIDTPSASWDYDGTADGQRFLIVESARAQGSRPLSVVINWQAAVTR